MCHRHLKRNMSNTSPFFQPPKPPLPSHLYLVKRHRHPPSCPKHEPPLGASPFLPSHIQSEVEKRLSLCSLPLLPYLRCLSPTLVASLLASCTTLCGRDKGGSTPLSTSPLSVIEPIFGRAYGQLESTSPFRHFPCS